MSRLPLSLRTSRVVTSVAPRARTRPATMPGAKSSTSSGVPKAPRWSTSLDSSTTTTNRSLICATTFSRVWAPPAPLVRLNRGSTSSAPSMAMSRWPISSGGDDGQPERRGQLVGPHRRGGAHDVGMALAQRHDREVHGRARPEPDPHAVGHLGGRLASGRLLGRGHRCRSWPSLGPRPGQLRARFGVAVPVEQAERRRRSRSPTRSCRRRSSGRSPGRRRRRPPPARPRSASRAGPRPATSRRRCRPRTRRPAAPGPAARRPGGAARCRDPRPTARSPSARRGRRPGRARCRRRRPTGRSSRRSRRSRTSRPCPRSRSGARPGTASTPSRSARSPHHAMSSSRATLRSASSRSPGSRPRTAGYSGITLWIVATGASPAVQQPPGLVVGQVDGLERLGELAGVAVAGRMDPPSEAGQGVERRLVDRLPARHEVAEGLGHPVDVALPVHAGLGFDEAALVLGEPARQREVVQAGPHVDPGVAGGAQHLGVVLDRSAVVVARLGLEPRPLERQPVLGQAVLGEQAEVLGVVGGEAVAVAASAAPGRPPPRPTSRWPVPRPRSGSTRRPCPRGSRRAVPPSSRRVHGAILPQA